MAVSVFASFGCVAIDSDIRWPDAETIITLDDAVTWIGEIELYESDAVINVSPMVGADPWGGFLIADSREAQLRLYNRAGELKGYFGSRGDGPGELRRPRVLLRSPDGNLLAFDSRLRLVVFDSLGMTVQRTVSTPFARVDLGYIWDDSTVMIAGQLATGGENRLLHFWDTVGDSVRTSFFDPTFGQSTALLRNLGWASVARLGDEIVATYSMTDTLYVLDRGGVFLRGIPIPIDDFRKAEPSPTGIATREWQSSFDLISSVHSMANGEILVEWLSPSPSEQELRLVLLTAEGEKLFALRNTSRLLTVVDGKEMVFVQPGSLTPNKWVFAQLRY